MARFEERPVFYVSSRGHSASKFLQQVLVRHPDIVCWHGNRSIPPYDSGTNDMEPEDFVQGLYQCAAGNRFQKVFGSVHGFYGPVLQKQITDLGGWFGCIFRDPIPRLVSHISGNAKQAYTARFGVGDLDYPENVDHVAVLVGDTKESEILIDRFGHEQFERIKNWLVQRFRRSCRVVFQPDCENYVSVPPENFIRMEDMVRDPHYIEVRILKKIHPDLAVTPEMRAHFERKDLRNTHNRRQSYKTWESWSSDMRRIFAEESESAGVQKLRSMYTNLGYSFPDLETCGR